MKTKELIECLKKLDPEHEVVINIRQANKKYGFQLSTFFVSNSYGGSITVSLPRKAYVVGLPKDMEPI